MIMDVPNVKAVGKLFEVIFLLYSMAIKLPIKSYTAPVSRRTASKRT